MYFKRKENNYLIIFLLNIIVQVNGFSNGVFDYTHQIGEKLSIMVGPITSPKNPIPFNYYHLGICKPMKIEKEDDSLGEILTGKEMFKTQYEAFIKKNEFCKIICVENITESKIKTLKWVISNKYSSSWFADKLPSGYFEHNKSTNQSTIDYLSGIPIGERVIQDQTIFYYIYNHFQFRILLHETIENKYEVVGFNILPFSIKQTEEPICEKSLDLITKNFDKERQLLEEGEIMYTYDIIFELSNRTLVSRWDFYQGNNKNIHLAGVIISNIVIVIFTILVLILFYRAINKDIESYNIRVTDDTFIDEVGWKQVCNDVFRPCMYPSLFASLIGIGIQLFLMLFFTLFFATLGFLRPEQRTNILTLGLLFFVFMGIPAGYTTSRILRVLKGDHWLRTALITAFMIPGCTFSSYTTVNILLAFEKSSAAVNFFDILSLLILWLCCSTPLVLIGSFFGIKRRPIKIPCKINPLPTAIPPKPIFMQSKVTFWIAGIISFSTIFIEFAYIMASLWKEQFFFVATFLWIAIMIMVIVSGEVSIILVYINLCRGDYNWWWKSFFFGGSSSIYIALYSTYYFFTLNITRFSGIIVYIELMTMISIISFLVCGSIATLFTFVFLKKIYSLIKID